jgi:hypothetical protein
MEVQEVRSRKAKVDQPETQSKPVEQPEDKPVE